MKKRGFTLIELLAVIVILAILLAIVIPKIINVISTAKQNAFVSTNKMIESEISRINSLEVVPQVYTFENGVMTPDIGITGKLPTSGTIEINSNKEIQILTNDGDFCAIKKFNEYEIKSYENGDPNCNLKQEIALTIDPNGGEYNGSTADITYQILPDGKLILDTPVKDDNIFAGWDVTCNDCLVDDVYTVGNSPDTIKATWELYNNSYTYTGTSTLVEDTPGYWKLKLLTSGTFTPLVNMEIDAFLVGGGGGGGTTDSLANADVYGGGGGYTKTYKVIKLTANTAYTVTIGAGGLGAFYTTTNNGGTTSAFGYSALGGNGGGSIVDGHGNGGSGGGRHISAAGSDGSNSAGSNSLTSGLGQGTTTREFGEPTSTLYAGGGANGMGSAGGAGGGGATGVSGTANTGGGGGSNIGYRTAGSGGSGIVVIRKSAPVTCVGSSKKFCFKYSGNFSVVDGNKNSWKLKLLTSGYIIPYFSIDIDAFLVGGGGGGMYNYTQCFDSVGGGGGYTSNVIKNAITAKTSYPIVIGNGGRINYISQAYNGENTTAFGTTAAGGVGGGCQVGGSGGSGGGYSNGSGGSNGSNGGNSNGVYGVGQGTTTREFGEIIGDLYAGGGGGGYLTANTSGGAGGGGGKGVAGTVNTGGGGGSNSDNKLSGKGGSGIVVIRAAKTLAFECIGSTGQFCFKYTGFYSIENEAEDNWKIKLLTSGTFTLESDKTIDAFLVGGGAAGGTAGSSGWGGMAGGAGGYVKTLLDLSLQAGTYEITVAASSTGNGNSTTAFSNTVLGGTQPFYTTSTVDIYRGRDGGSGGGPGGGAGAGGAGGSNGSDALDGSKTEATSIPGRGAGVTTKEFGESTGTLYAGGGGGGSYTNVTALGGAGGGGNGGSSSAVCTAGTSNTGGGGGGTRSQSTTTSCAGGSGIVIIRAS